MDTISPKEIATRIAVAKLTEREAYAFQQFCDTRVPPIAPSTAGRMFAAYLQGQTCEDIAELMPGFSLGQIVHARVVGDWDVKRDEHMQRMLNTMRGRVAQSELETVDLIANLIAASKKAIDQKVRKYLISGDENELKGVPIATSLKEWTALYELLLRATGQDTKKIESHINHSVTMTPPIPGAPPPTSKPMSSNEAAIAVEALLVSSSSEPKKE